MKKKSSNTVALCDEIILPGERRTLTLPVADLYTQTPVGMPIRIINGTQAGPRLFISAAIHGDELNGVEIIRRVLKLKILRNLRGTLITIPIVNIFGLIQHSRYLPDRRDLNRSFPGSECGSLASRLANLFMTEIVAHCTHGIDLHTGAYHRSNLPQIRANLSEPETERLALVFGAPVILNSVVRDGSLREAAAEYGIPMLLYEAGEALRFDETSIAIGVKGIVAVMRDLGMLPTTTHRRKKPPAPTVANASTWLRAPQSGILRILAPLGKRVEKGDVLGIIADPFGDSEMKLCANNPGIIIGRTQLPLVNEGEAVFHIARPKDSKDSQETTAPDESFADLPPLADDPPLI